MLKYSFEPGSHARKRDAASAPPTMNRRRRIIAAPTAGLLSDFASENDCAGVADSLSEMNEFRQIPDLKGEAAIDVPGTQLGAQIGTSLGRVCRRRFAGPSPDAVQSGFKEIARSAFFMYYQRNAAVSKDGTIAA